MESLTYLMTADESKLCWKNVLTYHRANNTVEFQGYMADYAIITGNKRETYMSVLKTNELITELNEQFLAECLNAQIDRVQIRDETGRIHGFAWQYQVIFQNETSMMEFRLKWL